MIDKYIEEMEKIVSKHTYSMYDMNYEKILGEVLHIYNKSINKINDKYKSEYLGKTLSILFELTINLSKKDLKKYIKLLKKHEIYKLKDNNFFMKNFLKLYINIYMLKNRNFVFFRERYMQCLPKKVRKQIWLFFKNKNSNIFKRFKTLSRNKLYVDYMELVITTKCTLNCKNCANLMPMYKKPYNVDKDIIIKSIKKIAACVDEVYIFRILGGEPFCNPELKNYLREMPENKFREIVIVTNGTLVPKDPELINIIREKNITVEISDYGKISYKKDELIEMLKKEKINYKINSAYRVWYDYGSLENKNKSKKSLKRQFSKCDIYCKSILNGALYYCPRHSHGIDLGKIKKNDDEYVDLLNNSDKENRKKIKELMLRNKYIEACNYCNYATRECKSIPAGEQNSKK